MEWIASISSTLKQLNSIDNEDVLGAGLPSSNHSEEGVDQASAFKSPCQPVISSTTPISIRTLN